MRGRLEVAVTGSWPYLGADLHDCVHMIHPGALNILDARAALRVALHCQMLLN